MAACCPRPGPGISAPSATNTRAGSQAEGLTSLNSICKVNHAKSPGLMELSHLRHGHSQHVRAGPEHESNYVTHTLART